MRTERRARALLQAAVLPFASVQGVTSLALAVVLALAALVGAVLGSPAPSILAGLSAIPVGLYAAVATLRPLVPVALAAATVGALVIAWWIYELFAAISESS